MPSRAYTSFLRKVKLIATYPVRSYVSMPFRAYISFLLQYDKEQDAYERIEVSMPSRAYTSFLLYGQHWFDADADEGVNALSGLYLISTVFTPSNSAISLFVSMPSRAYTSFLHKDTVYIYQKSGVCQCPLGLIPHFYGTPSKT